MRKRFGTILLLAGGGALLWCATVWIGTELFEQYQAQRWNRRASTQSPPQPAPLQPASAPVAPPPLATFKPHEVIGWLEVPRLRISTAVVEGDDDLALQLGAGHIPGTALPGVLGNTGIAAHRDSFFRKLGGIHPQDQIRLRTAKGEFEYTVQSTYIVPPSDVGVLADSRTPELTLVTCYPFRYIGPAPLRFIVHAYRSS
jgi:sortase A